MQLSILTWNIWDTPYFGSRHNSRRIRGLIEHIHELNPDLVLLQEAFRIRSRKYLAERLEGYNHPDNIYEERKLFGIIPFFDGTGGLVTFSRYPVFSSAFCPFRQTGMGFDERISKKGYTRTSINTPAGPLVVVNTHLANKPKDTQTRQNQLGQIFDDLQQEHATIILGGDLNTAIDDFSGDKSHELKAIEKEGFKDSLVGHEDDSRTFSHRNLYNRYDERGRFDYVFYRNGKLEIKPRMSRMHGVSKPVSDHYGYLAVFEMNGSH